MVDDWVIKTMYATKRRKRTTRTGRQTNKETPARTNPSKRHRERLNAELDHVAELLPFDEEVISKMDKLSILRLSVSYLRIKNYFFVFQNGRTKNNGNGAAGYLEATPNQMAVPGFESICPSTYGQVIKDIPINESNALEQALNGFLFVVSCDGEVFFVSKTVENYLGFQQSDIIHQSVLELIHSQDRDEFRRQLAWRPPAVGESMNNDIGTGQSIERSFTVRFRCLLDNTSGFVTLEISGRILPLYGQSPAADVSAQYGLFAICSTFGPLPLLEMSAHKLAFRTKHSLDMGLCGLDTRAQDVLGYGADGAPDGAGYDLIHPADVHYYASAHREVLKTGSSGLIAYRMRHADKSRGWVWLQTGARIVYKANKPDCIICRHKQLTEEQGQTLLHKRFVEFKLPYSLLETECLSDSLDDPDPVGDIFPGKSSVAGPTGVSATVEKRKRSTTSSVASIANHSLAAKRSQNQHVGNQLDDCKLGISSATSLYYELYGNAPTAYSNNSLPSSYLSHQYDPVYGFKEQYWLYYQKYAAEAQARLYQDNSTAAAATIGLPNEISANIGTANVTNTAGVYATPAPEFANYVTSPIDYHTANAAANVQTLQHYNGNTEEAMALALKTDLYPTSAYRASPPSRAESNASSCSSVNSAARAELQWMAAANGNTAAALAEDNSACATTTRRQPTVDQYFSSMNVDPKQLSGYRQPNLPFQMTPGAYVSHLPTVMDPSATVAYPNAAELVALNMNNLHDGQRIFPLAEVTQTLLSVE